MRRALLTLVLALVWPYHLAAQRDTTVCTAFRTRTAGNGAVLSTSVAKVACGGASTPARVDTVKVPSGRDTVYWSPQATAGRDSVVWFGPYPWPSTSGRPASFKLPLGPGAGRVDTVKVPVIVVRVDTVYRPAPVVTPPVVTPPPAGNARAPELPRGTVDTAIPVAPAGSVIIRVPESVP